MIRERFGKLALAGLLLGLGGLAQAAPMTWHDSYSTNQWMNWSNNSHSWTWDIGGGANGFVPGSDLVLGYQIALKFGDGTTARASFDQPGLLGDVLFFKVDDLDVGASLAGLVSLNVSGLLSVTLRQVFGSFHFVGGDLRAWGITSSAGVPAPGVAIPEPGTLALLGLGLMGIGFARRRHRA